MLPSHVEHDMAKSLYDANWDVEKALATFQEKHGDQLRVSEKEFIRLRAAIAKQRMRELIGGRNSEELSFSDIWSALGALRRYVTERDEEELWRESRIRNRWGKPSDFEDL
jgi:hypothetical protein